MQQLKVPASRHYWEFNCSLDEKVKKTNENEQKMNKKQTKNERKVNEKWAKYERKVNEKWTKHKQNMNEKQTKTKENLIIKSNSPLITLITLTKARKQDFKIVQKNIFIITTD